MLLGAGLDRLLVRRARKRKRERARTLNHPRRVMQRGRPTRHNRRHAATVQWEASASTSATRSQDWDAYLPDKAPEGAPNVLVVLYDDTGCAAWSPYGGRIEMPTLQRLADGRPDLHAVAHDRAVLADPLGLPHRPQPPPERLRVDLGDVDRASPATTRTSRRRTRRWRPCCATPAGARSGSARTTTPPSTRGRWARRRSSGRSASAYDRFYGFIGGETNQWYPDLAEDNHYIDQPYQPEEGYHLSKDLADKAIDVHPRLQAVRAGQALVPVVLPRRQPRAAPRAAGLHRQVQGQVRRRLRGLPRMGAPAHDRARHPARGHRADADQPDDAGHVQPGRQRAAVGHAGRRGEGALLPHGRGLRRRSRSTPTTRSGGSSTTSRSPASSTTP